MAPALADSAANFESAFDQTFGTDTRGPRVYASPFEARLASLAEASKGRIGVAAVDLASGRSIDVLGDQRFPMASTSKIAIAATFLEGVDKGRWSLTSEFPLMIPVKSAPFSTAVAPVREGQYLSATDLIELMLTRSNNYATDALLKVVGGPRAVNEWVRRAGISDWQIDRDIATLVRDDGAIDPASVVDTRDSATPYAMVQLLTGIYQGKWLSPQSRSVLMGAMSRCVTGKRRIPAMLPETAQVAHKTGSLYNTSSDVGIIETPDGHAYAVAIYVTGQGTRVNREARIASIARAIYDGYQVEGSSLRRTASR
ncbi:class A beta-lactamase-related serine hydrolase [Novosphingobium sp. H3SJ31-1]|uniref:Beta-lactamase n=2 Tax=Novosphingobium album (ex Liu et al. 2023) TaxID=3031130 RepID=A0ABT5WT46_9SPHN|nr:serine hydrolase [Novosphingobium album (ex Liu et al. 2023)]MDE8653021.1 class A beta-lactamase-related serine hydrolase [Novosphingobium album (ex Liu et al. 2023)]